MHTITLGSADRGFGKPIQNTNADFKDALEQVQNRLHLNEWKREWRLLSIIPLVIKWMLSQSINIKGALEHDVFNHPDALYFTNTVQVFSHC